MRFRHGFVGLFALAMISGPVVAQSVVQTNFIFRRPLPCDNCGKPVSGPVTVDPSTAPKTDQTQPSQAQPAVDPLAFAQAPAAGGEAGLTFNPAMFGDLGASGRATFVVLGGTANTPTSRIVRVPVVSHGSFKISDNESPRPVDRVFMTYNYFDRVTAGGPNVGLNRELIGFEKTFLSGNASIGMRLPFLQATGGSDFAGFANHSIGELTLISKYAFINNRDNGNVLSAGLALTLPTADHSLILADGSTLRSVLFQPYSGWIVNLGDYFYAHGFHSLVVPSDSRDITELNNDVGVGAWAYRNADGFIRGIVPTVEGHLYSPLNHRNSNDLLSASHIFTLTGGVNFVLPGNSTLGAAVAVPLTGPRPDNIEALVSFNFRF